MGIIFLVFKADRPSGRPSSAARSRPRTRCRRMCRMAIDVRGGPRPDQHTQNIMPTSHDQSHAPTTIMDPMKKPKIDSCLPTEPSWQPDKVNSAPVSGSTLQQIGESTIKANVSVVYKLSPRKASAALCLVVITVISVVLKRFRASRQKFHHPHYCPSSFLLRPSLTVQSYKPPPEPDPSGNIIQSFSLPVQIFDATDSQLSPAALFHLFSPKPPPDPSHQADNINVVLRPFRATHTALDLRYDLSANIPRLKCCVLNTREPPDPLSIRYDLSATIPRLKCCNTREPLHLRLTPTPVLTLLRLAPVLPRPPSTALT